MIKSRWDWSDLGLHSVLDGTEIVCKSTCHQEWEDIDVMNLLLTVTINKISQTENTNISTGKAA